MRGRRAALAALFALLVLGATGCSALHARETVPYRPPGGIVPDVSNPPNGFVIYQRDCGWCHGSQGEGTGNGPPLTGGTNSPALTDLMLSTGRMPIASPAQKNALHQPAQYTEAQVAAIVAEVATFNASASETAIPAVDAPAGNLAAGKTAYEANCAACHSATGAGGVLATGKDAVINGYVVSRRGLVAPPLLQSTATQIAEAIRTGPPGMPDFGPSQLSDAQVNAIAHYIEFLQKAPDPGGLNLGRIGPVAEGAAGWVLGLGVLLLLVRWIGTSGRERSGGHGGGQSGSHGGGDGE
ncbi:MAG TPA: c-type cytochrome [Actinomycetota bacterium]|nr:c-type cytochrome [Actinomycetota bacterium]